MPKRVVATSLLLLLMAWVAQAPWGAPPRQSLLRLSWRTLGEEIKIPRAQDANLPAHMKLPEADAFDVRIRPYRLLLVVDGVPCLERRIESPGMRHDRPLSVFEEVVVTPGSHAVVLTFRPEDVPGAAPPRPTSPLEKTLSFAPGRIVQIGMDTYGAWQLK